MAAERAFLHRLVDVAFHVLLDATTLVLAEAKVLNNSDCLAGETQGERLYIPLFGSVLFVEARKTIDKRYATRIGNGAQRASRTIRVARKTTPIMTAALRLQTAPIPKYTLLSGCHCWATGWCCIAAKNT